MLFILSQIKKHVSFKKTNQIIKGPGLKIMYTLCIIKNSLESEIGKKWIGNK